MNCLLKPPTSTVALLCLFGVFNFLKAEEAAPKGLKEPAKEAVEGAVANVPAKEAPKKEDPAKKVETPTEDEAAAERKEAKEAEDPAKVARPVSADPVQVYGWREWVTISANKEEQKLQAKLDTGALTSSIHTEDKELFERDGKKWVRFVVTDPGNEKAKRMRIEAPLVRIARIKQPGGESEAREVVRLMIKIGARKLKADFTLNNRQNMLSPVLIGRRTINELGWVDPGRAYLADKKVMR